MLVFCYTKDSTTDKYWMLQDTHLQRFSEFIDILILQSSILRMPFQKKYPVQMTGVHSGPSYVLIPSLNSYHYFFTFLLIYFTCMDVFPAWMSTYHMCTQCPEKRVVDPRELERQTAVSHHACGCWDSNLSLLGRQQVILTAELSLQRHMSCLFFNETQIRN